MPVRMRHIIHPLLFSTLLIGLANADHPKDFDTRIETIAFGSCNRQTLPQPMWDVIAENEPDLWIWAGDNIYGDSKDPEVIRAKYEQQLSNPSYAAFRETTSIIGTWDDHDFGWNNAGREYPIKQITQQLALDFMGVPKDDPRRNREGIYGSYEFGPKNQRVKVLLLDGRYFASGNDAQTPELLGGAQKEWLENELLGSTAQIHFIVSGIQIVSEEHRYEHWGHYPQDRSWLIDLIAEADLPGIVLLSGDRHIHEFSLLEDKRLSHSLLDATSSGLTHSWKKYKGEKNRHRIGEVYKQQGFGLIQLDWAETSCIVTVQIRDGENQPVNAHTIEFSLEHM